MNKRQQAPADRQEQSETPGPKATVEDLQPRPERAIQGGKVKVHDIPFIVRN
jgi:hypothetical protein